MVVDGVSKWDRLGRLGFYAIDTNWYTVSIGIWWEGHIIDMSAIGTLIYDTGLSIPQIRVHFFRRTKACFSAGLWGGEGLSSETNKSLDCLTTTRIIRIMHCHSWVSWLSSSIKMPVEPTKNHHLTIIPWFIDKSGLFSPEIHHGTSTETTIVAATKKKIELIWSAL